jgi:hypothetical protein
MEHSLEIVTILGLEEARGMDVIKYMQLNTA